MLNILYYILCGKKSDRSDSEEFAFYFLKMVNERVASEERKLGTH